MWRLVIFSLRILFVTTGTTKYFLPLILVANILLLLVMTLLEQLRKDYNVEWVKNKANGSVEINCGRLTDRLDHYMCGNGGCDVCESQQGWCDSWYEECARPIEKKFEEWKKKHVTEGVEAVGYVGEKGDFYVTLSRP